MKIVKTVLGGAAALADFGRWHLRRYGFNLFSPRLVQLANVAEGFRPFGRKTYYPTDQPYSLRYLLVTQAAATDAGYAALNALGISLDDMCKLYPTTRLPIPLGFMADAPGGGGLDIAPISGTVQLLGGAQNQTILGVADGVIAAGSTLLVGSGTTAGYVGALPSAAGAFYTVGVPISTSEGAALPIEIDPRPAWVAVQVVT